MHTAILIALIFFFTCGALVTIGTIGKPRSPVTPGVAVAVTVVNLLFAAGAIYLSYGGC